MSRTRTETIEGLESEWATFEQFLRGLSPQDIERPTRCEAWTVRDIAAHLVGGVLDVAGGTVGISSGQQHIDERTAQSAGQLADDFNGGAEITMKLLRAIDDHLWAQPSPFPGLTVRQGVEVLWLE